MEVRFLPSTLSLETLIHVSMERLHVLRSLIILSCILNFMVDFCIGNTLRGEFHHLIVLFNLSGKLLEDLFGQLNRVVLELLELNKLNKVSCGFSSFRVDKITIVIIKLVHNAEVSISNSNDN